MVRLAEMLDQQTWFTAPVIELGEAAQAALRRIGPRVGRAAAELAAGVAGTVQHDDLHNDLHNDNVLIATAVGGSGTRFRVIDCGDAVIAHPFGTLRLSLGSLRESLAQQLASGELDAALDAVTSAYLEGRRTGGVGEGELRRQVAVAHWLEAVTRAAGWIRALGTVEQGLACGDAAAAAGWLVRMSQEPLADSLGR